jgi:hypothetical protein
VLEILDSEFGGGPPRCGNDLFRKTISIFSPVGIDDCPDFIVTKYVHLSETFCKIGEASLTSFSPPAVELTDD